MAIPSGSGTEVLHRGAIFTQTNDPTSFKFDGTLSTAGTETDVVPANHIVTVLSIIFCESAGAAEAINLYAFKTNNIYLLKTQAIAANETFVWNDKIVLTAGDALKVTTDNAANVSVWYSYIVQNWT